MQRYLNGKLLLYPFSKQLFLLPLLSPKTHLKWNASVGATDFAQGDISSKDHFR